MFDEITCVYDWIKGASVKYPNRMAIYYGEEQYSYEEVMDQVKRFANALQNVGVIKNDRVSLLTPNCPEFVISLLSISAIGGVVIPINVQSRASELEYLLKHSESKILIIDERYARELVSIRDKIPSLKTVILIRRKQATSEDIDSDYILYDEMISTHDPSPTHVVNELDDEAIFRYTSGTTGNPKACVCSHKSWLMTNSWLRDLWQISQDDCSLVALPIFHNFGQGMTFPFLNVGANVLLMEHFDPLDVLQKIEQKKVTVFAGVPAMYVLMLDHPKLPEINVNSLRKMVYGGARMPVDTILQLKKAFDCELLNIYGLSETGSVATYNSGTTTITKADSVGRPFPNMEVRIVGEDENELAIGQTGEICLRSDSNMKGYYKSPGKTEEAFRGGWLHSGDIGHLDNEGFLFLKDRKDDMINRGGENIFPKEIEEIMYSHPKVLECAIVGVADRVMGQAVKAFIVTKKGNNIAQEELENYLEVRIARYKLPKYIEFVDSLPMIPSGKINRNALRKRGNNEE